MIDTFFEKSSSLFCHIFPILCERLSKRHARAALAAKNTDTAIRKLRQSVATGSKDKTILRNMIRELELQHSPAEIRKFAGALDSLLDVSKSPDARLRLPKMAGRRAIFRLRTTMQARDAHGNATSVSREERPDLLSSPGRCLQPWHLSAEARKIQRCALGRAAHHANEERRYSARRTLILCRGNPIFVQPLERLLVDSEYVVHMQQLDAFSSQMRETVASIIGHLLLDGSARDALMAQPLPDAVRAAIEKADTIFVEWCNEIAVIMSWIVPPDKGLVIRLHSFEAFDYYAHLINWSRVDNIIFVAAHIRRFLQAQGVCPEHSGTKVHIIPNLNRLERYRLPKTAAAARTLALIGYSSANKNPIQALDILGALRRRRDDWRLILIGHAFPEHCEKQHEEAYRKQFFSRLLEPDVRGAVDVRPFSDELEAHLTEVGYILSTSEREGTHESVLQAMASGCVPIIRCWPIVKPWLGDDAPFSRYWFFDTTDQAVERIERFAAEAMYPEVTRRAQHEAMLNDCGTVGRAIVSAIG